MRRYRRLIGTSTAGLILACGLVFKSGCGVDFAHKKDVTGLVAGGLLAWLLLFQDNDLGGRTSDNGTSGTGDTGTGGDATAGAPADGRDGVDGINCWDLNADGIADVDTEDANGDGTVDIHDCRGRDGAPGAPGADGANGIAGLLGPTGPQGPVGPAGPQGAAGPQGPQGVAGSSGSGSAGSPGEDGSNGLACWDLNGNGLADVATEDTNGDGSVDVFDCRGLSFFDIFIDDYFGPPDGLDGSTPPATDAFVRLSEPVLGGVDFFTGRTGIAIAFRVAIPVPYTEGNDVTMRLTFHRTGELGEDCFKFKVDRARLRDGQDVELYPDPRYVTMDLPDGVDGGLRRGLADLLGGDGGAPGKTLVVDLPINIGAPGGPGGRMDGLGFWVGDLEVADLIAFELSVDPDDLVEKFANVRYHLLGVEFYEGPVGSAKLRGARIFDFADPPCDDCGDADCNGNGTGDLCELEENDCNENGIPDDCDLCDGLIDGPAAAVAAGMTRNFAGLTGDVLILGPTVSGGAGSLEATLATGLGFSVDVVDGATWGAMNTADFASYKAVILGDPNCVVGTSPIAAAEANVGVWGPAVSGNVVVIGTDPQFHQGQGGSALTEKGIAFAASEPGKTGAYITLSCYYDSAPAGTPVPLLDAFVPGGFSVTNVPGCFNDAHIVASNPAIDGLTDGNLSGWGCSVHEAFDNWPVSFQVLAIAVTGSAFTASDGTVGTPYIVGRGLTVISDIDLAPLTAVNPVGTSHTVTATVVVDDEPQAGVEVTFTVIDGPHVGTTGTATTDNGGQASFTYSGTSAGLDTIHATFVDGSERTQTSNTVTKEWVGVECSLDCNHDGIPDECQLEENDCNENRIPDDCELCDDRESKAAAIATDMPRNFAGLTGDVLILNTTVSGGLSSLEATKAIGMGMTVDLVDAATWGAMNAADFASYRAIILGDATCGGTAAAAEANTGVWGPAVTGNVVIIGSDPEFHRSQGGDPLTEKSIAFATSEPGKTGAYITLSCYFHGTAAGTPVPLLDGFVSGGFTVTGVGCFNNVHIVATHPALDGLTDGNLSNWSCSVHEAFDNWPVSFQVLAIAVTGSAFTASDGTEGTPYIIGRGLTVISDIDLVPLTAENPIGTSHTVTATVVVDDAPQAGVEVTFTVIDGPHVGTTGTATTDNSGQASFTYTGSFGGLDTIHATFIDGSERTQTSNTVTKDWIEIECEVDCNHDGILDECQAIECCFDAECEDDDVCTEDSCDNGVCIHEGDGSDSDGDGVPNCFDECPETPSGASVDEIGCPLECGEKADADIVVMIDRTGGVRQADLDSEKTSAKQLLDFFSAADPKPNVAIGTFNGPCFEDNQDGCPTDGNARIVAGGELTTDYTALAVVIDGITVGPTNGQTDLASAMRVAQDHLIGAGSADRPDNIILITDGIPNIPECDPIDFCDCPVARASAATEADSIRSSGTVIFAIHTSGSGESCSPSDEAIAVTFLQEDIADDFAHYFEAGDDLSGVFILVAEIIGCDDGDECTKDVCIDGFCFNEGGETGGPGIDTDDHVFIWDAETLRVSDIDTLGQVADINGTATTSGGFDDGHHMVFDTVGQRIFVADHDSDFMVFDTSATRLSPDWSALNLDEPLGIAPLPNGQLLITAENDSSGLFRINADLTLDAAITGSHFDGAEGVAYDSVHDLIYVADEDDGDIEIFNRTTLDHVNKVPFFASCGSEGPYWLGVDGSSNRLFVLAESRCGDGGDGPVYGIHVFDIGCLPGDLSYNQTIVGSGGGGADCYGTLTVSESTDRLFAIDYCNDTVAVFDTATLESLGAVSVDRAGAEPLMVSVGHLDDLAIGDK